MVHTFVMEAVGIGKGMPHLNENFFGFCILSKDPEGRKYMIR